MPFVHIRTLGASLGDVQRDTLQRNATRPMANVMNKKAEPTAVLVEEQAPGAWSVGGASVPVAAHLEAVVTAGTNSGDEKAAFVREAHALLADIIEVELPLATYVVVQEVGADSWGYGGRTQEARRQDEAPLRPLSSEPERLASHTRLSTKVAELTAVNSATLVLSMQIPAPLTRIGRPPINSSYGVITRSRRGA